MIRRKVLFVTPYPLANPQHGGQKRARALLEYFERNFEAVRHVSVYHRGMYEDWSDDDLLLGDKDIISQIDREPLAAELVIGESVDKDIHVRSRFADILFTFKPDIIHIEQVYLYAGVSKLLAELGLKPLIIIGSQNIEYRMKEKMFTGLKVASDKEAKKAIKRLKALEEEASLYSDLVVTVSVSDAKAHKEMGARKCIVVPNGIEKTYPSKMSIKYWDDFKRKNDILQMVTFVGSGHPPNWMGYLEMMGKDSSFLGPRQKVVLAGGVSDYFSTKYKGSGYKAFWSNVLSAGRLSEDSLSGLIRSSDVFILPITSGGGSNLKTAEAILSGKKVVGTSFAFRGFEKYSKLPNIYLADTQTDFIAGLKEAIERPLVVRTKKQSELAEQVRWQYCVKPITPAIKKLILRRKLKSNLDKIKAHGIAVKNYLRHLQANR